ncbi:uroporphyrinogen-III synthase [Polyangium aurulentum]|uniref:uroporphyrinogen-III synthase n=1 Tax=Polyangium aurulentum TaxID=2567896 RepID=UPI00197EE454|nr:uroporphyrinogen-III synthase [Polyangium aurulentum]UQA61700.1 uroporphyrinogen-III synthase [Polyangium aurulentum]
MTHLPGSFGGRLVVGFESRRAAEMASLIERHGGAAVSAPSLREVALEQPAAALPFAEALAAGRIDVVVLMTGVGTRGLVEAVAPVLDRSAFAAALARTTVVVRGHKPASALRELGVTGFVTVPAPNSFREVLGALDGLGSLAGRRVAVQEYGAPNRELAAGLEARGAEVLPVAVYRYALPEDTAPLRRALHRIAEGEIDIALFTSRAQVEHALLVAGEEGIEERVRARLVRGLVGSVGPVCSEALRLEGLPPDVEPEHPKMGHLVKEAAARAGDILAAKASGGHAG